MIGISLRAPEHVDWTHPLLAFIQSHYTADEAARVSGAPSRTQELRVRVERSVQQLDADSLSSAEAMDEYLRHLFVLRRHFTFGNAPTSVSGSASASSLPSVRLPFVWYESFRRTAKVCDYDINFEIGSVAFNLAAVQSRRATLAKSTATASDEEPIKQACQLFQKAAGVFEWIGQNKDVAHTAAAGISVDLSSEGIAMLTRLMLAQAQACLFERSTNTVSATLVAKLAQGVSELFRETARMCSGARLRVIESGSEAYAWSVHCMYQATCYCASSHWWWAKSLLENEQYGDEIAHLERAKRLLEDAMKLEAKLLKSLPENRSKFTIAIQARLSAAYKDNDTIYYAQIPKTEQVKDVESVVRVKCLPFTVEPDQNDPYSSLIPPDVKLQVDEFMIKSNEQTRELIKEASDDTMLIRSRLNTMGLPAKLEALLADAGVSEELWNGIVEAQHKGGYSGLQRLGAQISIARAEAESAVRNIVDQLNKEKADDSAMRVQFAHRWVRYPSEQLTATFQRDLDTIRLYLTQAEQSNGKIAAELSANTQLLVELESSRAQLNANLPQTNPGTADSSKASQSNSVNDLQALLNSLRDLVSQRDRLVESLRTTSSKNNVAADFIAGKSLSSLLTEHAEMLRSQREQCSALKTTQQRLLESVTYSMSVFEANRVDTSSVAAKREAYFQKLNSTLVLFNRLVQNMMEGQNFYADLQRQRIQPLTQRVTDYVVARNMEKQMIVQQLVLDASTFTPPTQYINASERSPPSMHAYNPNMDRIPNTMYSFDNPLSSGPEQYSSPSSYASPSVSPSHVSSQQIRPLLTPQPSGVHSYSTAAPTSNSVQDFSWTCAICTLRNYEPALCCIACNAPKGSRHPAPSQTR